MVTSNVIRPNKNIVKNPTRVNLSKQGRPLSNQRRVYKLIYDSKTPLTQKMIKKKLKIKSVGNLSTVLNDLLDAGKILEQKCPCCEQVTVYVKVK